MKRRQYLLLVALTVVTGLIGGAVSNWLFMARTAEAQETKKHEKVVKAEAFLLVNKEGRIRGIMSVNDSEEPMLTFYDEGRNPRMIMAVSDKGDPLLEFYDEAKKRMIMTLSDKGDPFLELFDEGGKPRMGMALFDTGDPNLHLCDEGGTPRIIMGFAEGVPGLSFYDEGGKGGKSMWSAP